MELVVAQPFVGERLDRRHVDRAAEGARLAEPHVVDEDDQHVRRAFGRLDLETRRRRRVARIEFGVDGRLGLGDRQDRAVQTAALRERRRGAEQERHWGAQEDSRAERVESEPKMRRFALPLTDALRCVPAPAANPARSMSHPIASLLRLLGKGRLAGGRRPGRCGGERESHDAAGIVSAGAIWFNATTFPWEAGFFVLYLFTQAIGESGMSEYPEAGLSGGRHARLLGKARQALRLRSPGNSGAAR